MKIHHVGAELFHADRQTDTPNLRVAFRNFVNAPKHRKTLASCYLKGAHRLLSLIFSKVFYLTTLSIAENR